MKAKQTFFTIDVGKLALARPDEIGYILLVLDFLIKRKVLEKI